MSALTTPRKTRVFNVPNLITFQHAIAECLDWTQPWGMRSSVVLVPSRAASNQLRWSLERLAPNRAMILPLVLIRDEFYLELHRPVADAPPLMADAERLVCGRAAAIDVRAAPGLVGEFLGLYDELRRRHRSVDAFERLLVDTLEPSNEVDLGARRMLRQTRFLAAMFRAYERRVEASGCLDEHGLRARTLSQ